MKFQKLTTSVMVEDVGRTVSFFYGMKEFYLGDCNGSIPGFAVAV